MFQVMLPETKKTISLSANRFVTSKYTYILTPDMGMPFSGPTAIFPYISELLFISASSCIGMSKYLHKVGSQLSVSMFISIVLEAFVTSVI